MEGTRPQGGMRDSPTENVSDSLRTQCASRICRHQVSSSKGEPDEGGEESLPDPPPESSSSSPSLRRRRRRLGASAGQAPLKGASEGARAENVDSGTNERVADHGNGKSRTMVALEGCRDKGAHQRNLGCDARGMGDEKRVNGRPGGSGTANGCDGSAAHGSSKQSEDSTVRVILAPIV